MDAIPSGDILVLGAGLIGGEIARTLAERFMVTAVDINQHALSKLAHIEAITPHQASFTDIKHIRKLAKRHAVVVGAMPDDIAFETIRHVITAGADIVDISFFEENPFKLSDIARQHNRTVVVDCGVSPGMSNLLFGFESTQMYIDSYTCFVGGLPKTPTMPWKYKAPFAVQSVINEWSRPVRLRENGRFVLKPPLSDPQYIELPHVGKLEAINTDGLRTLLTTTGIRNLVEKTLRYPGHREYLELLYHSGFFSTDAIDINGFPVVPAEVSAKLLESQWRLEPEEDEFTVMRLVMKGRSKKLKKQTITYDLFDKRDPVSGTSSMARTTGYTCAAVAHLLMGKKVERVGVVPPEFLGKERFITEFVLNFLKERNVIYEKTVT